MHPILQHLMDTDFRDLAGTRFEGQVALSDEVINLGLGEIVAKLTAATPPADAAPAAPPASPSAAVDGGLPDPQLLLKKLKVDHLRYRTEAGRTIVEVKAGLGGL